MDTQVPPAPHRAIVQDQDGIPEKGAVILWDQSIRRLRTRDAFHVLEIKCACAWTKRHLQAFAELARTLAIESYRQRNYPMRKRHFELIGWWLFVISALGFVIASVGTFWSMIASLAFLAACVFFLIPYYVNIRD